MKPLKILLVQAALSWSGRPDPSRLAWLCEPVALTSLAAVATPHEVRILDLRISGGSSLGPVVRLFRPDLVLVAPAPGEHAEASAVLRVAKGLLGGGCTTVLVAPEGEVLSSEEPTTDVALTVDPEGALRELLAHLGSGGARTRLNAIAGLRFRGEDGVMRETAVRPSVSLDTLPPPARHLLTAERSQYFFAVAQPAAAMRTSRGRRTVQRMSAETICDRLEIIPENFVVFLDEDLFVDPLRLAQLSEAMLRRDVQKYWAAQASPEQIAELPHLILSLRDAGLAAVILTFDLGEADGLEMLLDPVIAARNRRAAGVLRALGVAAMGLFTVRRDLSDEESATLAAHVRELGIAWSVVRGASRQAGRGRGPLPVALEIEAPGTTSALKAGWEHAAWELLRRRPRLLMRTLPGVAKALGRSFRGRASISSAGWSMSASGSSS
ncbi:hypothetical protein [Chondromyces crocatus]|nr:hypothetical protein [Chondromyces crocatus]